MHFCPVLFLLLAIEIASSLDVKGYNGGLFDEISVVVFYTLLQADNNGTKEKKELKKKCLFVLTVLQPGQTLRTESITK